jgi:hypothetical protein
MQCEQARQLFDAYLDGELSPSLATELGAHRLRCADCRQALALLEVSGHILRSDRDTVQASDDFTDRLLACVDTGPTWRRRVLHTIYVGGPLAAAAVIALAFIGVFDGKRPSQVAGVKELASPAVVRSIDPSKATVPAVQLPAVDPAEKALGDFIDQTQQRMKDKGDSVQRVLDLTILQMLDILEEAKERSQHGTNGGSAWTVNPAPAIEKLEREPAPPEKTETVPPGDNDAQEQPQP